MKILVTGAGGMLGSDLVSVLCEKHGVVGGGRRPAPHLKIPYQVVDLTDAAKTERWIEKEKPEVILHAAAMTKVDLCETNRSEALAGNLETTRSVTEACNRIGAPVFFFSTDFVFDGTQEGSYAEDAPPCPINVYGESKLLAERYLLLRGKRFFILRTSWLYGKEGDNFPKKVLRQAETGKPFRMVSDQYGNPTYSRDLADAVSQMLQVLETEKKKENQIYHVANAGSVSRYELALAILKKRKLPVDFVTPIPSAEVRFPARRPQNSVLSTEKLKSDFGIQLRGWEEALAAYLKETEPVGAVGGPS